MEGIVSGQIQLPKGIIENIFQYRFKEFLKRMGKPFSGKPLFERLYQALSENDPYFNNEFQQFIIEEISNGRNREIHICNFSIESLRILGSYHAVQSSLAAKKLPFENFNSLLDPNTEPDQMVYLNIQKGESNKVNQISMAFTKETVIEIETEEGMTKEKSIISYVWIDIFPNRNYLQIKFRPYTNNYIVNFEKTRRDFDHYWKFLKDTFGIVYTNMSESKSTLYNIFKVLTEKAEAPYSKKVNDIMSEIETKVKEIAQSVRLSDYKWPVDIPVRVARLFERALILSDITNYKAYDSEKIGIVDRIDFSDQSGAKVNALSGDEGIEVADIFFDTRETLDELKQLNKLWVRWFLPNPIVSDQESESEEEIKQVETRLEVFDNRVVMQFLNMHSVPKEVQDYVLSLFRKFEEGEIS
jgi:hypothetical protein